jgi:hypothetical protein
MVAEHRISAVPVILRAARPGVEMPFGAPERVASIGGHVEAPSAIPIPYDTGRMNPAGMQLAAKKAAKKTGGRLASPPCGRT